MTKKSKLSKEQLKRLLIDHSILEGIRLGHYTEVIEFDSTSKSIPKGRSLIISYYKAEQYICTKHELKRPTGDTVHQDVEAVFIDGTLYERL